MGLDMMLNASLYLSKYNDADKQKKEKLLEMFPELKVYLTEGENPVQEVKAEIGYWRKANQIHNWFVNNVQNGEDDCRSYYVDRKQLEQLKSLCQQVLEDKSLADKLLPTQSGFFFGSTEYEGYYFTDLEDTVKIIDNALALPDGWTFEYHSSW